MPPSSCAAFSPRLHRSPSHPSAVTVTDSSSSANPAASEGPNSLEVIRRFAETYAKNTGTYFCQELGVTAVVLAGLETHVCVAQTAFDLLTAGMGVFIAVDAVASRHALDHDTALRRLEGAGAILTTSEAVLFEWCRTADHPQFQAIRRLVR